MVWDIKYYRSLPSTNTTAKLLAADGAIHGTVIVADEQTQGRGQHGRSFLSPQGGLYLSVILRPDMPLSTVADVTRRAGVAVCRAVGLGARIKPVNDVRINGKKLCGILTESGSLGDKTDYVVIGIGINVKPVGEGIDQPVTSVSEEAGRDVDKQEVLKAVLKQLERVFDIDLAEYEELMES